MPMHARNFQTLCRHWRQFRKLSQLDLALAADISQRHISWLETGKSQPSRDMVLRLSEALDVPLRERNNLFVAAGYAPAYNESALDDPAMAPVLDALSTVLQHHDPLPAVVIDRAWNVKLQNQAAEVLFGAGAEAGLDPQAFLVDGELNLALMSLHPQGLRNNLSNWDEAAPAFIQRLRRETQASGDEALAARIEGWIRLAGDVRPPNGLAPGLLPVLPLELTLGDVQLGLFSVISTFGTPQDVTTDELRIETFYPIDADTRAFFSQALLQS